MDFGDALKFMREGKRVKRVSWHFDAQLTIMPGYLKVKANIATADAHGIGVCDEIAVAPYFSLYNRTENTLHAWTPRTIDLLAKDWQVV